MIRKVVAQDILIIHVNIAVHAKLKSCAETLVRINQRINALLFLRYDVVSYSIFEKMQMVSISKEVWR